MDFLSEELNQYVEIHTESESDLLKKINRDTYVNVMNPRMLSGHLQGRVLSMFTHMIRPKHVLEIGTFTGYSALSLAEGIQEGGSLDTIDINAELEEKVTKFIKESPYQEMILQHIGNALDIIPTLDKIYDLVFIDADKENYKSYYELVLEKMPVGGIIIVDNVLWSGKVLKTPDKKDKSTQAILEFNKFVHQDERVQNVLFPVRDGLMILRKK